MLGCFGGVKKGTPSHSGGRVGGKDTNLQVTLLKGETQNSEVLMLRLCSRSFGVK